jgi:hypothetical protein
VSAKDTLLRLGDAMAAASMQARLSITPEDKAVRRLQYPIKRARDYLAELDELGTTDINWGWAIGWQTQALRCLVDLAGPKHDYTQAFRESAMGQAIYTIEAGVELLEALRHDIENGYFIGFREMVHADLFSDFLDMAQYLLEDGGFKVPAAVMAGGVLEEHLRKLCQKHGISAEVNRQGKIEPKSAATMNDDLARDSVYTKTDQKLVLSWLGIRNDAAHAHYDNLILEKVGLMIQGIRHFVQWHPA